MLRALPLLFAAALHAQAPAVPAPAPPAGIMAVVQRQMDAYNAHDAQAYAACFAPGAQLIRHPGIPQLEGHDEIYRTFAKVFRDHKDAKMRVLYRAELGPSTVIEHQEVDGIEKSPVPSLAIYSVRGGLIQAAWFVLPE
jgi:hypothetical protein